MPQETLGAPVEQGPKPTPEVIYPDRRVLFVPGITASYARNTAYNKAFRDPKRYGEGNVLVMNSIVSNDRRNRGRFGEMQQFITQSTPETRVDIGGYSLGAVEVAEVLDRIHRENPGYWEDEPHKDRFHFMLIDPSGFNTTDEQRKAYKKAAVRLFREHGNFGIFSRNRNLLKGIDSLIAFPPEGVDMQDLISAVREVTPSLSRAEERDGLPIVPFEPLRTNEAYKMEYLSEGQRAELERVDSSLQWALSRRDRAGNLISPNILRRILQERGEILKVAISKVSAGKVEEGLEHKERWFPRLGGREGRQILRDALGSRPMEKFIELYKMGYKNITLVSTEHGIAVPLGSLLAMFASREEATAHVQIAELATHPTYGLQPETVVEMMWNM